MLANVRTRTDAVTGLAETAFYDALNRLEAFISVQGAAVTEIDVDYAANGNISFKTDVGNYTYAGPRPHAVTTAGSNTYTYDANGQMTSGAGRTIQWTAFNQINRIDGPGAYSEFSFGAAHERVKQVRAGGTTIYAGALYEKFTPVGANPVTEHRHWIMTPAGRIAVHKTFSNGAAAQTRYFLHDGLGSITAVLKENGSVEQRFRYDAWGKRLDINGQPVLAGLPRGFTDHEHLEDLGLIHMNGRVYDPLLARFLSADPFIDGVGDSQKYNRYSYVHNNPLNATDPSGYLSLKDVVKVVAVVVAAYFTAGLAVYAYGGVTGLAAGATATFGQSLAAIAGANGLGLSLGGAIAAGAGAGFASGLGGSLLNGGSIGEAFKAGIIGGVVGGIAGGLAYGVGSLHEAGKMGFWERAFAHGGVQGAAAEVQGGEFRHGFYAGFFTASAAPVLSDGFTGMVEAAVIGGTASVLGGGKFANGAISGAFQYLLNDSQHDRDAAILKSANASHASAGRHFETIEQYNAWIDANSTEHHWYEGSGTAALDGFQAFIDGVIPFANPLENRFHFYDSNRYGLNYSQNVGAYTRDAMLAAASAGGTVEAQTAARIGVNVAQSNAVKNNVFRWGIGSFKNKGVWLRDKFHFHLGPGPGPMTHHLPYQAQTWRHHAAAKIGQWWNNLW